MEVHRKGFTLIELSAIALIILMLVPILFSVFHRAQVQSQQVTCANNLRLLGVACEMYQADWNEVLVPYGAPFTWSHMWPELLDVYIKRIPKGQMLGGNLTNVYRCPSAKRDRCTMAWSADRTYGINTYCGGWMPSAPPSTRVVVPLRKVRYPAATVRLAEAAWIYPDDMWNGTLFAPTPNPPMDYVQPPGWHGGLNNVLWIDGHVSAMTNEQYLLEDNGPSNGNVWCRLEGPKPAM